MFCFYLCLVFCLPSSVERRESDAARWCISDPSTCRCSLPESSPFAARAPPPWTHCGVTKYELYILQHTLFRVETLGAAEPVRILDDAPVDPLLQDLKVRDAGCFGEVQTQLLSLTVTGVIEGSVMEKAQRGPSHTLSFVHGGRCEHNRKHHLTKYLFYNRWDSTLIRHFQSVQCCLCSALVNLDPVWCAKFSYKVGQITFQSN